MLNYERIQQKLRTNLIGDNFIYLPEVASTNTHLMKLAREGAPEGTVVLTADQTRGKGRLQRTWYSRPGEDMMLSILIRPELVIDTVQKITLASATILMDAIESFFMKTEIEPFPIHVKWPNDLLVNGKKLAGILAESSLQGKTVEALIIGFGVNVNNSLDQLPEGVQQRATSIFRESGQIIDIEEFIAHFINTFERSYITLNRLNYAGVVEQWRKKCDQFGQLIDVQLKNKNEEAYFEDISSEGHLIYRLQSGKVGTLVSGDVIAY